MDAMDRSDSLAKIAVQATSAIHHCRKKRSLQQHTLRDPQTRTKTDIARQRMF
ncbi:hypothetical protein [Prochlorococcus marinus]|uniref:hypothetical protein n=1 Tax=Prochlorococcus marinus TaxID=1219 RepID=UPI001F355579|nr:hypothetical protein [Prochlorococcus marinus]